MLLGLGPIPSPDELGKVIDVLHRQCAQAAYPRKALATALQHASKVIGHGTLSLLRAAVLDRLESPPVPPSSAPVVTGRWLRAPEVAASLDIRTSTLRDRLKSPSYRHLYGWPSWDGTQWLFAAAAIDPNTSASFLAMLPPIEPEAVRALLPSWCDRQGNECGKAPDGAKAAMMPAGSAG